MTSRFLLLAWVTLALGCGQSVLVFDDGSSGGGGGDAGSGPGGLGIGGGGADPGCTSDSHCSALDGACVAGVCASGTCVAVPANDGLACDDGLFCSVGDRCEHGACTGAAPLACPGGSPCEAGACDETNDVCVLVPANDGAPCDDGQACTGDGTCSMGQCAPGPIDCSALDNACNVGVCTVSGCVALHEPNGTPCNDGNACTASDSCNAGMCVGSGGPFTYFGDDFSGNTGWTLGTDWQIGPTVVSMGQSFGNPDPAQDFSAGNDNRIAGVVLGGNVPASTQHADHWLTSPVFDATVDPGPVVLSFQRWLNSDWDPWMNNRIQVFNGQSWVTIWESGSTPVTDSTWTKITHDLTAYKNAAMQIRFGFSIGQTQGIFQVSGWNIDDVVVATASCP